MKRTLAFLVVFSMIFSLVQIGCLSVSADASGVTTLFNDDFTNYSIAQWNASGNYGSPTAVTKYNIDSTAGNATVKSTLTNNVEDAWIFNKAATADISGNGYIGVVSAATEGISDAEKHGNILKYQGAGTTTSFGVQRNVLNADYSATIGNTLKYSYDIFVPSDFGRKYKSFYLPGISASRAKYSTILTESNASRIGMELYHDGRMVAMGGYGSNGKTYNTEQSVGLLKSKADFTGAWHNITVVVNNPDESSASNPFTWRLYIDGKLQTVSKATAQRTFDTVNNLSYDIPNFRYDGSSHYTIPSTSTGTAASSFYGLSFGEQGNTTFTGAVYFDNIKAELVDTKFVLNSVAGETEAFSAENGAIKLNFSTPLITAVDTDFAGYDYKNNVKVVETSSNEVVENAVASAVVDGNSIILTFDKSKLLPTTQYNIVLPTEFADKYGQYISKTDYVASTFTTDSDAEAPVVGVDTVFDEKFENYTLASWTTNAVASGTDNLYNIDSTATNVIAGDWDISVTAGSTPSAVGEIAIVSASTEELTDAADHTNVLKYTNSSADGSTFLMLRRNNTCGDLSTRGKILTYEFDMYQKTDAANYQGKVGEFTLPTKGTTAQGTAITNYLATDIYTRFGGRKILGGGGNYSSNSKNELKYESASYLDVDWGTQMNMWHNVKVVVDTSATTASKSRPDTWRIYVDGKLISTHYRYSEDGSTVLTDTTPVYDMTPYGYNSNSEKISGYSMKDFYGLILGGKGDSGQNSTLYFDNIKAEIIDTKFEIASTSGTTKFNAAKDKLVLNFTTPVNNSEENLARISVQNSKGEVIEEVIKSAVLSNSGTTLSITLDETKLYGGETYNLVFPAQFIDIYGQGLVTYYSARRHQTGMPVEATVPVTSDETISVKLAKSTDVFVDDISSSVAEGTVTVSFTVYNITDENLPKWCVLAAYDSNNNMLGIDASADLEINANDDEQDTLEITGVIGIDHVKLFVWADKDTLKPYHETELIYQNK